MIKNGIFSFSSVDKVLSQFPAEQRLCLLDTNVLVGWAYSDIHSLGEYCEFIVEKLGEYAVAPFASVTTKSEFYDFVRRVILKENLLSMSAPESKWQISSATGRLKLFTKFLNQAAMLKNAALNPWSALSVTSLFAV